MTSNADRMIYLVTCGHQGGAYMPERDVADLDRKTTVKMIADGQFDGLLSVIECNPVEGICRDVTEDIMLEVSSVWADGGDPVAAWQVNQVETCLGRAAAVRFERGAR